MITTEQVYVVQVLPKGVDDCNHLKAVSVCQSLIKAEQDAQYAEDKIDTSKFEVRTEQVWLH